MKACEEAGIDVAKSIEGLEMSGGSVEGDGAGKAVIVPAPSGYAAAYEPGIHYPLLLKLKKKKKVVAPPSWATAGHRGGSACPCCKGKKMNPAFF